MKSGAAPMRKTDLIDAIKRAFQHWNVCNDASNNTDNAASSVHKAAHVRSCKKRHCSLRLLDILHSGKFVEDFGNLGNSPGTTALTECNECNKSFWREARRCLLL